MRSRTLLRLRPTLTTAIVGLVMLTALTIGISAWSLTSSIARTLIEQARIAAVSVAEEGFADYFDEGPQFTSRFAALAARGLLPINDRPRLAAMLVEELRATPRLHLIGYGDAAGGWYVGAARYGADEIVEYLADPQTAGGVPQEAAIAPDGTRSAPSMVATEPFFATTRPWFKLGIAKPGPVWTPLYEFGGGGEFGVSCMTRFTAAGAAAPTGVFHADLRIQGVAAFLSTLRVGEHGAVFLVDRDGRRVVTPIGIHVPKAAAALDAAVARHTIATLDHPMNIRDGGGAYEIVFVSMPSASDIGLTVGVVIDLADVGQGAFRHALRAAGIALVTIILAILCARSLSSRIARPVAAIATDLARVGSFSISTDPSPRSFIREVNDLGASVDRMKASLRSFAHYVPTDLVRRLLAHGREAELGGEMRRLTMFFSDITDSTTIEEGMEPNRLVEALGGYLQLMTGAINRHGGTVDKFIGDGVMAFFNAPDELLDHPRQACLAALEAQRLLTERAAATPVGDPIFHTRIGLGVGEVLVGNIGTPDRFAYTLLGDEVNLSARLEGLNKLYGTAIIASEAVRAEAGDGFEWRRLDRVAVKGRRQGTLVCELIGLKGEVDAAILEFRDLYETALDVYFTGEFEGAGELFERVGRFRRSDLGVAMLLARCRAMSSDPPADWDGVHIMHEK